MSWQEQNEVLQSKIIKPILYSNPSKNYRINKYQEIIMNLYNENGNENMCILDKETGKLIGDITEGKEKTTVGLNNKTAIKLMAKGKNSVIVIHNHPENYSFSMDDITVYNKIKQADTMILLTDNYKYYLNGREIKQYSNEYLKKTYKDIEKQIKSIYNHLNNVEIRDLTNQKFFKKVGWIYEKEKN